MSEEDKWKIKIYGVQYRKICLKKTNKKRKIRWKNTKKNQSNNVLMKIKEREVLKNVEVDVVTNFYEKWIRKFSWCWYWSWYWWWG